MNIAIVGDVHLSLRKYKEFEANRFKLLIDELITKAPNIVVFAGDLLDKPNPTLEEQQLLMYAINKLESNKITVKIIAGNHEAVTESTSSYDFILPYSSNYITTGRLYNLRSLTKVDLGIVLKGWTTVKTDNHMKTDDILITHLRANHGLIKEEYNIKELSECYSQVFMGDLHFRYSPFDNVHYTSSPYSSRFTDKPLTDYGYIMLNSSDKTWEYIDLQLPCKVKRSCKASELDKTLKGLEKHLVKLDISGTLEELNKLPLLSNVIYNKEVVDVTQVQISTQAQAGTLDALEDYVIASGFTEKYPDSESKIKDVINNLKGKL